MRSTHLPALLASLLTLSFASGEERTLCDPMDPANLCPGTLCLCTPDSLEVTFDGAFECVFSYPEFAPNLPVEATIVMDVKSGGVQGWSYGMEHEVEDLELKFADDLIEVPCGFKIICGPTTHGVQTCLDPPGCETWTDGGGWISAVILSFTRPAELPTGRQRIAQAKYALRRDAGPEGTMIRVSDRLRTFDNPLVDLNLTIHGKSRIWSTAIDGWIRRSGPVKNPFRRGDADTSGRLNIGDVLVIVQHAAGIRPASVDCLDALDADDDGRVTVTDAIRPLSYLFQAGPPPPAPWPACGQDPTPDSLTCREAGCR